MIFQGFKYFLKKCFFSLNLKYKKKVTITKSGLTQCYIFYSLCTYERSYMWCNYEYQKYYMCDQAQED